MENYLYFAETTVETTGLAESIQNCMVPASSFIVADPISSTQTEFHFKTFHNIYYANKMENRAGDTSQGKIVITLTHTADKNKVVMEGFTTAMREKSLDGFIRIADFNVTAGGKAPYINPHLPDVTALDILLRSTAPDKNPIGLYGAGSVSTFSKPILQKWRDHGVFRESIWVDLTGLAVKGDAANDVIGLDGVANAFIYNSLIWFDGIIFKIEISCIEAPTTASGTITQYVNFGWSSSGTLEYDDAQGGSLVHNTDTLVAGETKSFDGQGIGNLKLYILEGDTAASSGVYAGGQYLIEIYGMPIKTLAAI